MGESLLRGGYTHWVWVFCRGCGGWGEADFRPWCPTDAPPLRLSPVSVYHVGLDATHYTASCLRVENIDVQWVWEDLGMSPQGHSLPGSIPWSWPSRVLRGHLTSW